MASKNTREESSIKREMLLGDSRFCQALARRHQPRTVSAIRSIPGIRPKIFRHKKGIDLVYRRFFNGIIIRNSSQFREVLVHNLLKSKTYIPHSHGLCRWKYERESLKGRIGDLLPINKFLKNISLVVSGYRILPQMPMTSISSSISSNSKSLSRIAQARWVSRELMSRESIRSGEKGAEQSNNMTAFYGYSPLESNFFFPTRAIVQLEAEKAIPADTAQGYDANITDCRIQGQVQDRVHHSPIKHHIDPGHIFTRVPGNVQPEMRMASTSYPMNSWPKGLSRIAQARWMSRRSMSRGPMSRESMKSGEKRVGPLSNLRVFYDYGPVESNFSLPPQSKVQLKVDKNTPHRIGQRRDPDIPDYRSRSQCLLNASSILILQASAFPISIKRLPVDIKRRQEIDKSYNLSSEIDGPPAQAILVNRKYLADQPPPVEMEYEAIRAPSDEMPRADSVNSPSFKMDNKEPNPLSVERGVRPECAGLRDISKPPTINITKLSDQVQNMIEKRIKIERERRGIYV